jgi:hypothetical protein
MTRAKTWFDKLTTLSKVEGHSTPSSEKWEDPFLCALAQPKRWLISLSLSLRWRDKFS